MQMCRLLPRFVGCFAGEFERNQIVGFLDASVVGKLELRDAAAGIIGGVDQIFYLKYVARRFSARRHGVDAGQWLVDAFIAECCKGVVVGARLVDGIDVVAAVGENHKRRVARWSDGGEFCRSAFLVEEILIDAFAVSVGVSADKHRQPCLRSRGGKVEHSHC